MTTKWTKGPWKAHDWRVVDCQGEGGICTTVICDTATNPKTRTYENRANAQLIASAPALYEALMLVRDSTAVLNHLDLEHLETIASALRQARGEK